MGKRAIAKASPFSFEVNMEDRILEEFKRLFREADFQHLIKIGAPLDEYDHEALFLYKVISSKDSVKDIQNKIWDHFYESFCTGEEVSPNNSIKPYKMNTNRAIQIIGTLNTYKEIAEKIKTLLNEQI